MKYVVINVKTSEIVALYPYDDAGAQAAYQQEKISQSLLKFATRQDGLVVGQKYVA